MQFPHGRLTNGLVVANVAVFLVLWIAGWEYQAFSNGAMFPIRLTQGDGVLLPFEPIIPAWLTPVSAAFLHSGLMHVGFNMLMLLFCGRFVEQALGPGLMGALYVVGAYSAALAEIGLNGDSNIPIVGASGPISAILGAYALLYSRNKVDSIGPIPAYYVRIIWLLLAWIGIQLLISFAASNALGGIAIYSHIGGFLAGLILTRPLLAFRFRNA